jgi:hypothetical protein
MNKKKTLYTLKSVGEYNFQINNVSEEFILSCSTLYNLLDDCDDCDNIIPISGIYPEELVKEYIDYFNFLHNLEITFNNKNISYLDYMTNHHEDYIRNYTNKNLDPPHCEQIYEYYKKTSLDRYLDIDDFYDNEKFRKGLYLTLACIVRIGKNDEVEEIISTIVDRNNN